MRAWALVAGLTLLRLAYLAWWCPYELVGDEAQYWDWSRRLELSYHTKGPGIAWLIAATTKIFGMSEFGVRAGAPVCAEVMMIAVAALCIRACRSMPAGLLGVLLVLAIPAYHATSLLMTIDAPMLACWALAALGAWAWMQSSALRAATGWAILTGAALGVGFLFKYSIILLIPGLIAFALMRRKELGQPSSRRSPAPLILCALVALSCTTPIWVWNAQHHWAGVSHLLGRVNAPGGDAAPASTAHAWSWTTPLEFIGVQLGVIGPALVLMFLAWRRLRHSGSPADCELALFSICGAAPTIIFYLGVSFFTQVEANWPIGAYLTLIPAAARAVTIELDRRRSAAPRRTPNLCRALLHWSIGYGVVAAVGLALLFPLSRAPVVGRFIPVGRVSGARQMAVQVADAAKSMPAAPIIIGARYTTTALLAFYIPDHPRVCCAMRRLGDRRTPYDDFADTNLDDPALAGRPVILVGKASEAKWAAAFSLANLRTLFTCPQYSILTADRYGGPLTLLPSR